MTRQTAILTGERDASVFNRYAARGIDLLAIAVAYHLGNALFGHLGTVAALALASLQDAMGLGQSFGKRMIGLQAIEDGERQPCGVRESLMRNFPFVLVVVFSAVPGMWVFNLAVAFPLLGIEAYLVWSLPSGARIGDVMANTRVVERAEPLAGMAP